MKPDLHLTAKYDVSLPLVHLPAKRKSDKWLKMLPATFLLLLCCAAAQAQDPEIKAISSPTIKTQDTTIRKIVEELQRITDNDKQNSTAIQALLQGKEIDNISKYELIKNNIVNASETYYLLNKKIIDLKSRTTTNNLDVFITSLNNPESKALGFSLSDRIVELVEKIILKNKGEKNEKNSKIVESTKSIINSPIFQSFTSLTPPLAIANSVMNFLHSVSVNNKQINQKSLQEFEKELNKYVVYYTALNDANQKFEYGLNFNKDQLSLLQDNLYDHLSFTATSMKFPAPQKSNQSLSQTMNEYFFDFKKEKVVDYFNQLETKYAKGKRIDYESLLRENPNLKEVNNQLEDLVLQTKRYENLYNEYFTLLDSYYSKVNNSLKIAQDNGLADKSIIDNKQAEFRNLKTEAVSEIQASINIRELYSNTEKIKYRYRIF
ncbi:hypothetical protein [Chitinophaga nivalis]|uniref:TolC family protein n=1 Tax=Chitinophaga nivalis TaxID=2991709 RepID=A0ABT3IG15_9BACT|nr:hypothetical protein [Chitinophaga nivalis]MCW3467413.1 hypothetical protein [Chitinophaga nivalis]MCW3482895.1 hypothetical protein [Chitinophaga nivalis]